jgi:ferric iron reductase protein FhuF
VTLEETLAEVASAVPYFRIRIGAPGEGDIASAPLLEDGPHLRELIDRTAPGRGTDDPQVAASLFAQAYAFRVAGAVIACYALGGPIPDIAPENVAFGIARHRPSSLVLLAERTVDDPVQPLFAGHLAPFVARVHEAVQVGERLLWGNVAASCAAAFRALDRNRADADAFLTAADPWLAGLGSFAGDGWTWARTNCCLNYKTESAIYCDDCSLTR